MLLKKPLAQNLAELSHITENKYSLSSWSGAVNMIFIEDCLLLIKRSAEMPSHKGQIGFLGGHKAPEETCPKITAFRELEEESSLSSENFKFLGLEQPVITTNQNMIIPVVSRCLLTKEQLIKQIRSNGEWSHFILVRIDYLSHLKSWKRARIHRKKSIDVLFCSLVPEYSEYFPVADNQEYYTLWGATAKMIWNFFKKNSESAKTSET